MSTQPELPPEESEPKERVAHPFRTLRELVDFVSGRSLSSAEPEEGQRTEALPFPFLAMVFRKVRPTPIIAERAPSG